ncbi:E3 ubiquitin-protein ligase RNF123-like [Watersipora subatra]|uniref:E3 ubiquitin-protein ligase RNF123-like n=1 Tax=Watersipora subatra TaxID=2589382 RepID=UPI00355C1F90
MAAGGAGSSFGLASRNSQSSKSLLSQENDGMMYRETDILNKVFEPSNSKLSNSNLSQFITNELDKISSANPAQVRDGLLGPEEISLKGSGLYEVDRLGVTGQGNFSTVKANACVYAGKWMFEVLLGSKGLMQLGWCSLSCKFNHSEGVGDTPYSFAFDGNRVRKWNVKTEKYGESWLTGDVIACAIDCDEGVVTFYRNGVSMGAAFENICLGPDRAYFPAVSLSQGESVRLNFGSTPFIYPLDDYQPMELAPFAQLQQTQLLLRYVSRQLPDLIQPVDEDGTESQDISTNHILILCQIFEHLVPRIKTPYIMQGALIPFLKDIVEGETEHRDEIFGKLIDILWGLLEDHEIKTILEHMILCLLTLYRFCHAENFYKRQKSYLYILWRLMKHEASRKYAVKWILFDKMKFPLFIYIKPPDDSILQHIVPTVWWESQHVPDKEEDERKKKVYHESCAKLQEHVHALEILQVAILKELLCNDDRSKGPSTRFLFLHKFRELIKENISDSSVVRAQQCSLPVLLALFHRFVTTLKDIFAEKNIAAEDIYVPVDRFVNDSLDYFDLYRVGGLKSHLNKVHAKEIEESGILNHSSEAPPKHGNPAVDRSLIELLDGAVVLYSYGAHKQLQKMSNVLSETVDCYITALDDAIDKLNRCSNSSVDVQLELERSRQVFEDKVIEQSRHLSWLIAVINSEQKLEDVAWLFDAVLRTVENACVLNPFFEFMPEFYITVCVDGYMALKNFFKLSPRPFTSFSNHDSLLQRYGTFIAKRFADSRIVSVDTKDAVVQSLACFVCYKSSLNVLESLPTDLRESMVKSLLAPYENRAWAQTNWILARLWKGNGFGFRFVHLPHLAPARHQTQEIGAASLQKPCPSKVFQDTIGMVLTSDSKLATQFINSVLNQLNWAFSEFVGMIQELQQLSVRTERSFVEMKQLKICATCFDISVGLLRVLEMVTDVAPDIFLSSVSSSSDTLLSRLYQSLCLILNRVASKANVFETILSLNLPGMETVDHFPIVTAILGILIQLICKPTDQAVREKSLTALAKEPGFQFCLLDNVISSDGSQASGSQFADKKQFILRNYKEINATELTDAEELIKRLSERKCRTESKSDAGDEESLCTICYANENSVIFHPCKHTSCRSCITHQMLQNKKCFFCMAEITCVHNMDDGKELNVC